MTLPSLSFGKLTRPGALRSLLNSQFTLFAAAIAAALLILFRNFRYITQPRFWAEEGTLHFAYSFNHGVFQALFQPQVGYLNFWPNLATLLAKLLPLESAPLATTLMAFIVQLIPVVLILWSKSPLWESWWRKALGIAIFFFMPLTNEVWLNSVNSYTYFAVITFFILIDPLPESRSRRWIYRLLLVLAGLSGTNSCFLIPVFLFSALTEKNRERWTQTLLLMACAVVQVLLIFSYRSSQSFGERLHMIGLSTFGNVMWTQGFGLFLVGVNQMHAWARELYISATKDASFFQMLGRFLLAAGVLLLGLISWNLPRKQKIVFISSYGILMLIPMMFSAIAEKYTLTETGLHARLFLAPNIILGWMMLQNMSLPVGKNWKALIRSVSTGLCILLVGASLFWGIASFRSPDFLNQYWPDWKTEVQTWKNNPGYELKIQPEGWVVKLEKR